MKNCLILALCILLVCAAVTGCARQGETPGGTVMIVTTAKANGEAGGKALSLSFDGNGYVLERQIPGNRFVYTYDLDGKLLLAQRLLGSEGKLQSQTAYTYDTEGKLVKTEGFGYDEVYTEYLTEFTYDDAGNLIRKSQYQNDELLREYRYDADGKLLESGSYIAGESRTVYTYGTDGRLQRSETTRNGEVYSGWEYTYDANGRLSVEVCFRMSDGERKQLRNFYTYDEHGRCVRYDLGGFQGEKSYEVYTYDAMGNLLSGTYHHYSGSVESYSWTYDAQGRMLSMEREGEGYEFGYAWCYDEQGNMTAMTDQGEHLTFCYTWPEELPSWLREEIAGLITGLTEQEIRSPRIYTRLWNFEERNT